MEHDGGCMCGAVRYRMAGPPLYVHCCHCTECQRQNGSAFAVNAAIETGRVSLTKGETVVGHMPAASGRGQTVYRCADCGVIVWSHYSSDKLAFVRVGTLDDPGAAPPDIHIFTRSKQPWVMLPDGANAAEAYYDRKAHWPAESLARFDALMRA